MFRCIFRCFDRTHHSFVPQITLLEYGVSPHHVRLPTGTAPGVGIPTSGGLGGAVCSPVHPAEFNLEKPETDSSKVGSPTSIRETCLCMRAKLPQSCLILCDTIDCSSPGSSVHGVLQARILEWVAMPSSGKSSHPGDRTRISCVPCIAGRLFIH